MADKSKGDIRDFIQYTPETYFSDEEVKQIRAAFNGPQGAAILKIIRKVFIPSISDPDLPVEELGKDMWMGAVDFRQIPDGEVKAVAFGLQYAAKAIMGGIIQLKNIANIKEENPEQAALRRAKNSAQ